LADKRKEVVAVELGVNDKKLDRGMKRAGRKVRRHADAMNRDLDRRMGDGIGAAAAGRRYRRRGAGRPGGGARARGVDARRMAGRGVSRGMGVVKGAAAMGGAYLGATEVMNAKRFEETLVDLGVRGKKTREWVTKLRKEMIAISDEYGVGKEQIADYVGTIIDQTGNTELALGTMKDMTAVAFSTNTAMSDLAGTVVEMQSKLALAPEEFITALGVLTSQADVGKVPLSQMAALLPEVLNSASALGQTGIPALRDYGAVLQIAARGAGSLAEANTAMNRGIDQMVAKRANIEKTLGISLKKNGQWLRLSEVLKLITGRLAEIEKTGGKVTKIDKRGRRGGKVDIEKWIIDTFGIRGKKMILPMLAQARVGFGNRVGAKGGQGGLTSFDDLIAAGGQATIGKRVALKRKLSPELEAWNKSINKFRNNLHTNMLPALEKLGAIMPQLGRGASFLVDNWKALLLLWTGAKMLKFFAMLR
jgi:hypothetical protein